MVKLANVDEEVQTHDTDIVNLDETMSDLEDIVDSVDDDVTALNVENDEMQQRLTVLEEAVVGMFIFFGLVYIPKMSCWATSIGVDIKDHRYIKECIYF